MTRSARDSESMWAIRAGKNGEAHELFLNGGMIVLSDTQMGNLSNIPPTREAFYSEYRQKHPDATKKGSAGIGGKYFRFTHEVQIGDLVLYPSLKDKQVYVGRVTGNYVYDLTVAPKFPHQRTVRWLYHFPKYLLTEFAKRELGAARTFFKFKTHTQEIKQLVDGGQAKKFKAPKRPE
ncbi:MAG: hypothetical protein KAU38_01435 [Desulfobacterales bacterium]|nr:hypothetical protein [Desulfobacterales bacterium]